MERESVVIVDYCITPRFPDGVVVAYNAVHGEFTLRGHDHNNDLIGAQKFAGCKRGDRISVVYDDKFLITRYITIEDVKRQFIIDQNKKLK